jgi:bifunctional non-homologous end joining protein LigD
MTQPLENQKSSLYYKDGSSDKEYHIQLISKDSGWMVEFQYGRRGSSLKSGVKTTAPVEHAVALKAYSKVVQEKLREGYTESQTGAVYQSSVLEARFTGVVPQLLNPIEDLDLPSILQNDSYVAQEKHDGERRMIQKFSDGTVVGINRNGLAVPLPDSLVQAVLALGAEELTLDGEILGDRYAPFDLLSLNGRDLKPLGFMQRESLLRPLIQKSARDIWADSTVAIGQSAKQSLFDRIKKSNGEGLVFKKQDAPYAAGRPASGGNQLKFKFVASATVLVSKTHDTKSSVFFSAFDAKGGEVALGKVTIPPNHSVPSIGQIVEVQYLYAYPQGSLFQPVYKGVRSDQSKDDCTLTQLKYKAGTVPTEDECSTQAASVAPKKSKKP